jgi:hypothetical protein
VRVALVVDQGDLALAAGELEDMGADEAGEVEAIVVAVLLPVEAGAALLAGGDDGHLARQLPVCERSRRARSCCQLT